MQQEQFSSQGKSGIGVQDVLYILFRHKWKIIFFFVLGIGSAVGLWFVKQPLYTSQAKLLVRYVTENRILEQPGRGDPDIVRSPDSRNSTVINSEIEILTSQDAVVAAANLVGPEKILGTGAGTNKFQAGAALKGNMKVEVGRNSGVISITLGHKDPDVSRQALDQLIKEYLRKHNEVHRAIGAYDLLQSQTDQIRSRLAQTEEELRKEKNKANIISVEQAKADIAAQRSSLQSTILATEAEVAERRAELDHFAGKLAASAAAAATNQTAEAAAEAARTNAPAEPVQPLDPKVIATYEKMNQQLGTLRSRETELSTQFKAGSKPIVQIQQQIAETSKAIDALGVDPSLLQPRTVTVAQQRAATGVQVKTFDIEAERARVSALEAKLKTLLKHIEQVMAQAKVLDSVENTIAELQRKKEADEEKLRYFDSNLERIRFDQTVDAGKLNNISVVQEPTVAARDMTSLYKLMAAAFAGFTVLGLILAFVTDLVFDNTIKRGKEVENSLHIPLFVSIPHFGNNGHSKLKARNASDPENALLPLPPGEIPPWSEQDPMLPYYEAIRDRVVMSYAGDLHKPKIVGLTSCNSGAGVSRIAAGLAAALSRDVERNVLFIALERNKVSVTAFAKGRPSPGLGGTQDSDEETIKALAEGHANGNGEKPSADTDFESGMLHSGNGVRSLGVSKSEERKVEQALNQNLLSLAATGRNLSGASIVQSFSDLLPKLKASEYDYIIFDLPPITQTSGSLRLASQMERTLLVAEAEKSAKSAMHRARKLLNTSHAKVFAVLNKTKSYGPKFLDEENF